MKKLILVSITTLSLAGCLEGSNVSNQGPYGINYAEGFKDNTPTEEQVISAHLPEGIEFTGANYDEIRSKGYGAETVEVVDQTEIEAALKNAEAAGRDRLTIHLRNPIVLERDLNVSLERVAFVGGKIDFNGHKLNLVSRELPLRECKFEVYGAKYDYYSDYSQYVLFQGLDLLDLQLNLSGGRSSIIILFSSIENRFDLDMGDNGADVLLAHTEPFYFRPSVRQGYSSGSMLTFVSNAARWKTATRSFDEFARGLSKVNFISGSIPLTSQIVISCLGYSAVMLDEWSLQYSGVTSDNNKINCYPLNLRHAVKTTCKGQQL